MRSSPRLHGVPVRRGREHVGAGVHRRQRAGRRELARKLDHAVRGQTRHRHLEGSGALPPEAIHQHHVPVRARLAHHERRQLLEDDGRLGHELQRRGEIPAGRGAQIGVVPGAAGDAQHRGPVGPRARDQLDGVEPERHDEIRAPDHRLLQGAAREHPHGQRVGIGDGALGLVGREARGGHRLAKGAEPLRVGGAALEPGDDHRGARRADHLAGAPDVDRTRRRQRGGRLCRARGRGGRGAADVRREVEMNGSARLGEGEPRRPRDLLRRRLGRHQRAPLHEGRERARVIRRAGGSRRPARSRGGGRSDRRRGRGRAARERDRWRSR